MPPTTYSLRHLTAASTTHGSQFTAHDLRHFHDSQFTIYGLRHLKYGNIYVVKTVNDIPGVLPEELQRLEKIFHDVRAVESVVLYGSRAKGTQRNGSDIDLVIKGADIASQQLLDICWKIDDLLLPYKVDLSIYDHIDNKALIDHINRIGRVIFER